MGGPYKMIMRVTAINKEWRVEKSKKSETWRVEMCVKGEKNQ